jgi:hypothetical protein
MKLEITPTEQEMLIGLVGERLADLELSARAIQVLSSIYYKLNEEN